jgi:hypothetical protein
MYIYIYIFIYVYIYIYIYIEDACGGTSPHPAGSLPLVDFAAIPAFAFSVTLVFDLLAHIAFSKVPRLGLLS